MVRPAGTPGRAAPGAPCPDRQSLSVPVPLGPPELSAHRLQASVQARLDRAYGAIKPDSDRLQREVRPEMEDQDHPLVVTEGAQRAEQLVVGKHLREWVGGGYRVGGAVEGHQADLAATPQPIAADVDQDPVEPCVETGRVAQRGSGAPGPDQRILRGVLGFSVIAEDQAGQPERPIQATVGEFQNALGRSVADPFRSSFVAAPGRTLICGPDHTHKTRLDGETVLGWWRRIDVPSRRRRGLAVLGKALPRDDRSGIKRPDDDSGRSGGTGPDAVDLALDCLPGRVVDRRTQSTAAVVREKLWIPSSVAATSCDVAYCLPTPERMRPG